MKLISRATLLSLTCACALELPSPKLAPRHVHTVDNFLAGADELRAVFDERFADPRQAHPMRFCWDYWHVPRQYTLHRTQAASYFDEEQFAALTDALVTYGETALGCRSISPPWLSFYTDGCEQRMHADVPQGPLAYVLSLTDWEARRFCGGETMLLEPAVLDYWRDFDSSTGLESDDLITEVEPLYNRLTIFDARLPHGVNRVEGERDPRKARLVIHGWFTEPEPFFDGGLSAEAVEQGLNDALDRAYAAVGAPCVTGLLSVRLLVSAEGKVVGIERLADTLVVDPALLPPARGDDDDDEEEGGDGGSSAVQRERARVLDAIFGELAQVTFATSGGSDEPTQITIPFVFD